MMTFPLSSAAAAAAVAVAAAAAAVAAAVIIRVGECGGCHHRRHGHDTHAHACLRPRRKPSWRLPSPPTQRARVHSLCVTRGRRIGGAT